MIIGMLGFMLGFVGFAILGDRAVMSYQAQIQSHFPSPTPDDQPG